MQATQDMNFQDHFTHVIGEMAEAIAVRPNEDDAKRRRRAAAAVRSIMSYRPRDATEVMLAGHAVMYHEVIVDNIQRSLRGEPDQARRATRANIAAMDRAYLSSLRDLRLYQKRPDEGRRELPAARTEAEDAPPRPAPAAQPAPVSKARPPVPAHPGAPLPAQSPIDVIRTAPRDPLALRSPPPEPALVCMAAPSAVQAVVNARDPTNFRFTQTQLRGAARTPDMGKT